MRVVLVLSLLAMSSGAAADDRFAGLDEYVGAVMQRWEVPGIALAVVKDGETVLARGYGVIERGTNHQVTENTAFTIASCSKSFVATAAAILVDQGKLAWDDPVCKHLPELELANEYLTQHVTLRDLLCHRTGLRRADLLADATGFSKDDILRRLKYLEPIADLRTRFIYNNHMYTVLGEVVTRKAGKPMEQFIAEHIFDPLRMESTAWKPGETEPTRLALRHWRSDDGIVARPAPKTGGGIYSTVADMTKWLQLQLAGGTLYGHRLLTAATIREMHALQFSIPVTSRRANNIYAAQFLGSGLGWTIQDYRGRKMVSHSGSWGAMVAMMPDEQLGVVVLTNLDLESVAPMLAYDVFDAYLAGPDVAWSQRKWESTWLRNEPPGIAFRPRDQAKIRLETSRIADTKPSLPLERFVGTYESPLYGLLTVQHKGGRLFVKFGEYATPLSHWQEDSFYVRSPTRLTFDWLMKFRRAANEQFSTVVIHHIGWDKDEKDHTFRRRD